MNWRPVQPGPPAPVRIESAAGRLHRRSLPVARGRTLAEAIAAPLLANGFGGGAVSLAGLLLEPFAFVQPAESVDGQHVAYYSATMCPAGTITVASGTATFGTRDGAPFLHAHALWHDEAGVAASGHILPLDTTVAADGAVEAWGVAEAGMNALPDPETGFTLFRCAALRPAPDGADAVLGCLRPGEDLLAGIEALCRRHGMHAATVHSVVGSVAGARFADGRTVMAIPTELFVREGRVTTDADGEVRAELEVVLVDVAGGIHAGQLCRGENPVLICAEVVLSRS